MELRDDIGKREGLNAVPLRELEMQELKHSEESKNAPLVERCDAEELATFFGLPWDKHEYAKTPQDVQKGNAFPLLLRFSSSFHLFLSFLNCF